MADSNFIDYVKILCRSGKGGAGSRHFHRAKYVPKGGPDGGDGGRGGNIVLKGNKNMWTLLPLKFRRHIFAGNGESGGAGRSFGKDGEDVTVEVPCGTVVFDAETGEYLCEVRYDGEEVPLGRVNYVLRALRVPAGSHEVVLTFRPTSVSTTNAIGFGAIAVILLLFFGSLAYAAVKHLKGNDHAA